MGVHKHFGQLEAPSQIACKAYLTPTTLSIPHDTVTVIPLGSEVYDLGGPMHDTVTNNSRITVPVAGDYLVIATVKFAGQATPVGSVQTRIHRTTAAGALSVVVALAEPAPASLTTWQAIEVVPCGAGDYIELGAYQNSGSAKDIVGTATGSALVVKKL